MAAYILTAADAIVTALNAGTFTETFTATRRYLPIDDLKDFDGMAVYVVPRESDDVPATRHAAAMREHRIDVAVQQRVEDPSDTVTLDALLSFVEELADFLRTYGKLTEDPPAMIASVHNEPVFVPQHLQEWHLFTSVLTVGVRVIR